MVYSLVNKIDYEINFNTDGEEDLTQHQKNALYEAEKVINLKGNIK